MFDFGRIEMITQEPWYREATKKKKVPTFQSVLTEMKSELRTRNPKPHLKVLGKDLLKVVLNEDELFLEWLEGDLFKVKGFKGDGNIQKEYEYSLGETIYLEDIFRWVLDNTSVSTWNDQVASKQAADKYLLQDKRSGKPNKSKLEVKSFQPHFGVGPTYYGIIDSSCMSWLKDHEYKTEKEAKAALVKCKSGKVPLEFRGF